MNYSSYAPPPTASSGALRILKPDYPEDILPAGAYPTEAHHPSISTGNLLKNYYLQFPADGQRAVAADGGVILSQSPPEQTDLRALEHSINNIKGGIDTRVLIETYGPGSFSDLVHKNYSETGNSLLNQYYSNVEGPGLSDVNQRPRSIIGNTNFDPLAKANPKNSLTGISLRNAYHQFNNQFDPIDDEDFDFED